MVHRRREKDFERKHVNGKENILSKVCTAEDVLNYNENSFGRHDSGHTRNSFHYGRILWCPPGNYRFLQIPECEKLYVALQGNITDDFFIVIYNTYCSTFQ